MSETERNLRVADSVCREFEWEGRIFTEGEFVAILDGEIVAVTDNPDDAIAALRAIAPSSRRGMVMEVTPPSVDVIR
jgi:hypothetical protein